MKKQYRIKFLGGVQVFSQKHLNKAARTIAGHLADPSTSEVTPEEREALRDVLGALGLTTPDDPARAMGGLTVSNNAPIAY